MLDHDDGYWSWKYSIGCGRRRESLKSQMASPGRKKGLLWIFFRRRKSYEQCSASKTTAKVTGRKMMGESKVKGGILVSHRKGSGGFGPTSYGKRASGFFL